MADSVNADRASTGGGTRYAVRVADRNQHQRGFPFGAPGVAVGDAGARGDPAHRVDPGVQAHRGDQVQTRRTAVLERRQAVHADTNAHHIEPSLGQANRRRTGRDVRQFGTQTVLVRPGDTGPEALDRGEVVRFRGVGEMAEQPRDDQSAGALTLGGGREELIPLGLGRTVPAETGIELDLDAGRGVGDLGRYGAQLGRCGQPDVDSVVDGCPEVGVRVVQPGQNRSVDPGRAQLQRLGQIGDTQPAGAARQRRLGHAHRSVPIAVRLDHCHQLGPARVLPQPCDVVGDRREVDPRLAKRPGHGADSRITKARAMPASWLSDR